MSTPRFHLPQGHRSPRARRQTADLAAWVVAVQEAQETRADLAVSVAVDGIALVASRSVEDADHAVSVSPQGQVTRCSCWQWRRNRVCAHACYVAIRLWEAEMGVDLSEVGARALVSTLLNRYVAPVAKHTGKPWLNSPEGQETKIA